MTTTELSQVHVGSTIRHDGIRCRVFSIYAGDVQRGPHPAAKAPYFRLTPLAPYDTIKTANLAAKLVPHDECEFVPEEQKRSA